MHVPPLSFTSGKLNVDTEQAASNEFPRGGNCEAKLILCFDKLDVDTTI
jgi:hypothetical protein